MISLLFLFLLLISCIYLPLMPLPNDADFLVSRTACMTANVKSSAVFRVFLLLKFTNWREYIKFSLFVWLACENIVLFIFI